VEQLFTPPIEFLDLLDELTYVECLRYVFLLSCPNPIAHPRSCQAVVLRVNFERHAETDCLQGFPHFAFVWLTSLCQFARCVVRECVHTTSQPIFWYDL
jgi:hypothetical protein